MAVQRNDILWSGVLEDFFEEFLRFIFVDADGLFDFSKEFEFLDKTLAEMFPGQDIKHPKIVDKLVKVYMKHGEFKWFLVHVEVQGYQQRVFTRRMFKYYYKILEKYDVPVTCIAIFLGRKNKSNAEVYESDFLGTKLRFEFNAYYVLEQDEEELRNSRNPFAIVVLAALMALKFKGNINALYSSKIALVRHLLQFGFPKNKIQPLLDSIKLYINFDEELNIEFDKRLESLTTKKKKTMGIREQILDITKKQGLEIGLKEGETKAKTNIAKKMKLEGLSQALIAKLTGLSARQIRIL